MVLAAFTVPAVAKAMALFAATLLLGALFFYLAKRALPAMRSAFSDGPTGAEASQMLSQFRDLHDRGGLSSGEFQHIKDKLGPQVHLENNEEAATQMVASGQDALRDAARFAAGKLAAESRAAGKLVAEAQADQNPADAGAEQANDDDSNGHDARSARPDQSDASEAGNGAAGGGCDVVPHDGGDSTEESR